MMMNDFAWWWIFPLGGVILGVLGVVLVFRTSRRLPQRSVESPHDPLAVARSSREDLEARVRTVSARPPPYGPQRTMRPAASHGCCLAASGSPGVASRSYIICHLKLEPHPHGWMKDLGRGTRNVQERSRGPSETPSSASKRSGGGSIHSSPVRGTLQAGLSDTGWYGSSRCSQYKEMVSKPKSSAVQRISVAAELHPGSSSGPPAHSF